MNEPKGDEGTSASRILVTFVILGIYNGSFSFSLLNFEAHRALIGIIIIIQLLSMNKMLVFKQ